jgi:hypothetical protein
MVPAPATSKGKNIPPLFCRHEEVGLVERMRFLRWKEKELYRDVLLTEFRALLVSMKALVAFYGNCCEAVEYRLSTPRRSHHLLSH